VKHYNDFVYEEIRLERVRMYSQSIIDAEMLRYIKTEEGVQMMEDQDAVARWHILTCFGKKETWQFKAPSTWWQHLKLALRDRWPRLFRRLSVRYNRDVLRFGVGSPRAQCQGGEQVPGDPVRHKARTQHLRGLT
jgi:hypothetical protein